MTNTTRRHGKNQPSLSQKYFKDAQKQERDSLALEMLMASQPDNAIKNTVLAVGNIRLRDGDETEIISQDVERVGEANANEVERSEVPWELRDGF